MVKNPKNGGETSPLPNQAFKKLRNAFQQLGVGAKIQRYGTHLIIGALLIAALSVVSIFIRNKQTAAATPVPEDLIATAEAMALATLSPQTLGGNEINLEGISLSSYVPGGNQGLIERQASLDTVIPSRPRGNVEYYEVQPLDSLYGIADNYGLRPETILWGNYESLNDNPRNIHPGDTLIILPTDGVYYRYNQGETLTYIANYFQTTVEAILEWPGNNLDPYDTDPENPAIADGTWLIIPGGERELIDWGPPAITRESAATASYYGEGYCGAIYEGAVGTYTFIWPTAATFISQVYHPLHLALDIAGNEGLPVYAADNGVVVFSGSALYGFGNLVVIDHGNGWQTSYAHLLYPSVSCGQSVYQGDVIGALGNTGNSSGPHLHFEMLNSLYGKVNPCDYIGC